jgi:hypothetical protein
MRTILCASGFRYIVSVEDDAAVFGRRRPDIVFKTVDLPAPFAPMSATISPGRTSKEMPLMAWIGP